MTRALRLAVVALVVAAADKAAAATLCVNPRGTGGCHGSIQAAVDAAGPGDTIELAAGIYFENVFVAPGKNGLRITGAGKLRTTVDPDFPNTGPAFRVESDGVRITRLGIRNGVSFGIIGSGAAGLVVQGVRIVGLRGPISSGIVVDSGAGARILSNEIRSVATTGIQVFDAPGSIVRGNTVSQVPHGIIVLVSDNSRVSANVVRGTTVVGVHVGGVDGAAVVMNAIELTRGPAGLVVDQGAGEVRGNRLTNAGAGLIRCFGCTSLEVTGNTSLGSLTNGFDLQGDAPGITARGNRASRATAAAFAFRSTLHAEDNVAVDTGSVFASGHCFEVAGAGLHTIERNVATRCARSGFFVSSSNNQLRGNTATAAGLDGFTVFGHGPGVVVDNAFLDNQAFSSNAAGFAVTGTNAQATMFDGNLARRNRYGLCDDGLSTALVGNDFGVTSSVCEVLE